MRFKESSFGRIYNCLSKQGYVDIHASNNVNGKFIPKIAHYKVLHKLDQIEISDQLLNLNSSNNVSAYILNSGNDFTRQTQWMLSGDS